MPTAISVGPLALNTYTALIALAALGVTAWAWWRSRDARVILATLIVAATALAFGRAGYVALNWGYFGEHPAEIASLAGLSEHAAIIGALLALGALRWAGQLPASAVPFLAIALLLIAVAASLGCIPNGCAFGREVFWQTDGESSLAWRLRADWPDATRVNAPRWPTQLLMVAGLVAAWGIAACIWAAVRPRRSRGRRLSILTPALMLLAFAGTDFLIQFLRGDQAFMAGGLRIYQWFDLILAGLAVGIFAIWGLRHVARPGVRQRAERM